MCYSTAACLMPSASSHCCDVTYMYCQSLVLYIMLVEHVEGNGHMAKHVMLQAPQQQHEAANLISWDDSVCVQSPPTPTASAMKDCSQAVFVQQQRTDQCQQGTGLTEPQQQVLQLPEESNKQSGADTCLASRQDGYSSSSTASDSYDAALALIPKVCTHLHCDDNNFASRVLNNMHV